MHVRFEATEDELLDATQRFLARSKVVRSWRWKDLIAASLIAGVLPFIFFFNRPATAIVWGVLAALICAVYYPFAHRRTVEKRLRNFIRETFGVRVPFICEVELTPVGVWVRQLNTQTTYEWESVAEINESEDSVEIFTREGSGVIVRKRAFESLQDQKRFIEIAEGYLELVRVSDNGNKAQLVSGQS